MEKLVTHNGIIMTKITKHIIINVNFEFTAIHCWPDAKGKHEYLKYPHRHIFKCQVSLQVFHNDREVEFLALKDALSNFCSENWHNKNIGSKSCEMIAEELYSFIAMNYPHRDTIINVSEDGENGVTINYLH